MNIFLASYGRGHAATNHETKCEVRDVGCSCECLLSYRLPPSGKNGACQSCQSCIRPGMWHDFSSVLAKPIEAIEQLKIPGSYITECERNPFDMIKAHQPV